MNPKLTLNLGLRYDYQKLADPQVNNPSTALAAIGLSTTTPVRDSNNFAPRFGFSYGINAKTVVRGGYGIFFARTPDDFAIEMRRKAGKTQESNCDRLSRGLMPMTDFSYSSFCRPAAR